MLKKISIIALLGAVALTGCGKKSDSSSEKAAASSSSASDSQDTTTEAATGETTEATTGEAANADDWKSCFTNKLLICEKDWQAEAETNLDESILPYFSIQDLDDDGTPELFISKGMASQYGVDIYRFENNQLVELGSYGAYGTVLYNEETGVLSWSNISQGNEITEGYLYKDGELEKIFSAEDYSKGEPVKEDSPIVNDFKFKIGGVSVTEEEYNTQLEKFITTYKTDYSVELGRSFEIDEAAIKEALAE